MDFEKYHIEDFVDDESFRAYALGTNPKSVEFWQNWRQQHPAKMTELDEAKKLVILLAAPIIPMPGVEAAQVRIKKELVELVRKQAETPNFTVTRNSTTTQIWKGIAAAIILLITVGSTYFFYLQNIDNKDVAVPITMQVKETQRGIRTAFTLPDGSAVQLNSDSKLSIPSDFGLGTDRLVYLEGEAFFEVVKNPDKPFKVITNSVTTQVLGTSFNINNYFHNNIKIAVATGKVLVKNVAEGNMDSILLNPSEMAIIHEGKTTKKSYDPEMTMGWKDGFLVFKNTNFEEIVAKLEMWYGVDFEIDRNQKITGGFTGKYHNNSLYAVLEGISFVLDFEYEIKGKKIIIH
jgi:transmembrane sensor